MLKITGIALSILFCALLLKERNRPFAAMLSIVGVCMVFAAAAGALSDIVEAVSALSGEAASAYAYIRLMLKVMGLTLCAQLVGDICRDNGENALASMVETAAKLLAVGMVLPLFESIISIVSGLIK